MTDRPTPSTPPGSNVARRITPEDQPVFPCWLKLTATNEGPLGWRRFAEPVLAGWNGEKFYHFFEWHPDQPTAPTCRPDQTIEDVCGSPAGSFKKHIEAQRKAGGPEAYAMLPPESKGEQRTPGHKLLDRLLIISLAKNHEAGRIIADRIEELERENARLVAERDEAKAALLDAREAKNRYKKTAMQLAGENIAETEKLQAQLAEAQRGPEGEK